MVLPRLLHPVNVEIEPLARTESIVDEDFREPVQAGKRSVRYNVPGQINWKVGDDVSKPSNIGVQSEADGYILFRTLDLRTAGINTLKQGDRFVSTGEGDNKWDIDVYVVRVQPMGHYTDRRGATLVRAWFKDRSPSKQTRGGKPTFGGTFDDTFSEEFG